MSGTARVLHRYLIGDRQGPVFVTRRQPSVIAALGDRCPALGRGRLSYQQAGALFERISGCTLRALRHAADEPLGRVGRSGWRRSRRIDSGQIIGCRLLCPSQLVSSTWVLAAIRPGFSW